MKKKFVLLLATLLSAQFAAAQKTLYVYTPDGYLYAYAVNKVTFDDLFTFTNADATVVTNNMFTASFKVAFKSADCKSIVATPEVGICFSDVNENPTIADGKIVKGSSLQEYAFSIYGLDAGTTYYYRAYVEVNDVGYYGDVKSVTTDGKKSTNYKIINGHKFVDLDLPSGLLWATCNVGAWTSTDIGNYYAWGETSSRKGCDWYTYKHSTSPDNITKYNSSEGKTTLDQEDDAAYVNWGDSCRMPTSAEFDELCDTSNCTWTWTSMTTLAGSPIGGYKITSVKNGNFIFLPHTGYYDRHYFLNDSYDRWNGFYWSSTLASGILSAHSLIFYNGNYDSRRNFWRYYCFPVRPVAGP